MSKGKDIERRRLELGLTREQLAQEANISNVGLIKDIEREERVVSNILSRRIESALLKKEKHKDYENGILI